MGKIRKGRSERESIATITRDWVMNHRHILTPRDIEMLKLLAKFPVMTVEHLYLLTPTTMLPNGTIIEAFYNCNRGYQICRDRIRRLFDYHFVNKYAPKLPLGEGTSPQYIWLDRAGYRYLELDGRPLKTLTSEYMHHTRILDIYCTLIGMEREGILSMDYLEVCYTEKPTSINIEPDLIVAFTKDGYGYKYFIEVDNCEKKEKEELKKIDRYRDWELSSVWIREKWADLYKRKFPTLLYLFAGSNGQIQRRLKVFERKGQESECRLQVLPFEEFSNKLKALP